MATLEQYNTALRAATAAVNSFESLRTSALIATQAYRDTLGRYIMAVKSVSNDSTYQRKSSILQFEQENLVTYNAYASLWLWANAILLGKVMFLDNRAIFNVRAWAVLLLVFFAPSILTKLIHWAVNRSSKVNIYSTWFEQVDKEWHGKPSYFTDADSVKDPIYSVTLVEPTPTSEDKKDKGFQKIFF